MHALVGGIDQQGRARQCIVPLFPGNGAYRPTKFLCHVMGLGPTPVGQANFGCAAVHQADDHGACCTACTQNNGGTGVSPPIRLHIAQALDVTKTVGIASGEGAVGLYNDGVDCANALRQGVDMIDHGQGGHLVRNRQIAACKTQHRECTQCCFYVLWLNR